MVMSFYNRKGNKGENEIVKLNTETKEEVIFRIDETKESRIKKAVLNNVEDVRALLLELFK